MRSGVADGFSVPVYGEKKWGSSSPSKEFRGPTASSPTADGEVSCSLISSSMLEWPPKATSRSASTRMPPFARTTPTTEPPSLWPKPWQKTVSF